VSTDAGDGAVTGRRVATCQFEPTPGAVEANVDDVVRATSSLPNSTAVAVFPELCLTGYDLDLVPDAAVEVPGPATERLSQVAKDADAALVVGLPEADGGRTYNSLVYVDGNGVAGTYRKRRLWGEEAETFAAGDEPTTVETPVGTMGMLLCYDLNFPELALSYGEEACDLLAVSAAWRRSFERDWRLLCRARALDGTFYVVGSNHVGTQAGRRHAGGSLVAGPRGTVVAETTDGVRTASTRIRQEALEEAREKNPVRESRRS
jgi:predicted amidohydrolase